MKKSEAFPDLSPEDLVTVHYLAKYSYEDLQYHLEMADTLFKQNNPPHDSEYRLTGKTWAELKIDAMRADFRSKDMYFKMNPKQRLELKILQQCEKQMNKTND